MGVRLQHIFVAILTLGMVLAGCEKDDKVVVYTTPKDAPRSNPAVPPNPTASPTPVIDESKLPPAQTEIQWTVPQGWQQQPGAEMRYASFLIWPDHPEIQLTVIPLGAEAADVLPNVNRWEGQVGLTPSALTELPKVVKRVTVGDLNIDTVDLTGPESANPRLRILAAILPHADKTWFFKLQGPAELIGTQKGNFDAFIKSIHFANGAPPPAVGATAGGAGATPGVAGATPPSAGGASWSIPAGWQQEPEKPMRVASFKAGDAELIITQFGKDNIGGPLANINRWRGQAGLQPLTDQNQANPQSISVNGKDGALFDFSGDASDPNAKRVRVAMVYDGEQVWFFKLQGPAKAVGEQQPAFDQFLKSVQFGGNK